MKPLNYVLGQKREKIETASFMYVFLPSFFMPGKAKMQICTPDDLHYKLIAQLKHEVKDVIELL